MRFEGNTNSRWLRSGFPALVVLAALSSVATAQENRSATETGAHRREVPESISLRGCLGKWPNYFSFATDTGEGVYALTGNTADLEKYLDQELILEGHRTEDVQVEGYFKPFPALRVERIVKVVAKQTPNLSESFRNHGSWVGENNKKYGVKFAHPKDMAVNAIGDDQASANFATQEGAEIVSSFAIPETAYASSNFRHGLFHIFVNRQIRNGPSCMQFGDLGPQEEPPSPYRVGELSYAKATGGSAAMGSWGTNYYFHIFQFGFCYEVAFELWMYDAHNANDGCNVPLLSAEDELELIRPLLSSASFFSPEIHAGSATDPHSRPQITEFTASSDTADDAINRGQIRFSWATQNVDYVEFTYKCEEPEEADHGGVLSLVISENGPNRYCQNIPSFSRYSSEHFYRSPNGSADLGFGYFQHEESTSVVVTITPFVLGNAYPAASKSLSVNIRPYNPFQAGVSIVGRHMTLTYSSSSGSSGGFAQGTPLTITWTDERTEDACVNLYLVRDNSAGGEDFVSQLSLKLETGCLKPASRGSYTWTVTTKHSGQGFRILARTPGGFSGTLGPAFEIIPREPANRK